ncbi:fimbrial protein [Pseudomonas sp. WS 5079]|uniref:fimbrial protein n=1 Tax=Pseudomonas sp. WS 5079 TaxID=2717492 RepID=UPI0015579C18|nr:fimbrial protein [Pseudomonas sp. WS 5079]NMX63118.1 fimbrial protein [Pseudomonas sp. WS 5079]
MNKFFIYILLFGLVSSTSYASCYAGGTRKGAPITIDLSDKLSERNREFIQPLTSDFGSHGFWCDGGNAEFLFNTPLHSNPRVVGFEGGKYWVRVSIANTIPNKYLSHGSHTSAELNVPVTLRFTLMDGGTDAPSTGNTATIQDVVIARDNSDWSWWETATAWATYLRKLGTFIITWRWPHDYRDMFTQDLEIKYTPKMSTCMFNNAGLMVNLPKTGVAQLTKSPQPGYTPFTLNFSCNNLLANGSTDRSIDMFLSSNNLLPSDNSVLMDSTPGSAKGVGIKVAKRDNPNAPVVFSTSTLNRGSATSIFSAAAGAVVNSNFSVGMGAYYFPYSPAELTSGEIRATATLNIVYQ